MQDNNSNIFLCGNRCAGAKVGVLPLRFALSITVEELVLTAFCVACHNNGSWQDHMLAVENPLSLLVNTVCYHQFYFEDMFWTVLLMAQYIQQSTTGVSVNGSHYVDRRLHTRLAGVIFSDISVHFAFVNCVTSTHFPWVFPHFSL